MISIVDDDKSVLRATERLLKTLGYSTATFESPGELIRSGRLQETACLIADVQMPGMSGIDLQHHLKSCGYTLPLILMTAFPEDALRKRALDAGAVGFLIKPFSKEGLIACLDKALAHHRSSDPG